MESPGGTPDRLQQLRAWRGRKERDLSLAFLGDFFKKRIEKPYRQLGELVRVWEELVPSPLGERAVLVSFSRGVLTVGVPDSATLYELDRLLRGGVQRRLQEASKAPLHKVRLRVEGGAFQLRS